MAALSSSARVSSSPCSNSSSIGIHQNRWMALSSPVHPRKIGPKLFSLQLKKNNTYPNVVCMQDGSFLLPFYSNLI